MKAYHEFRRPTLHKQQCTAYNVGLACLQTAMLATENFTPADIKYIGECSMNRVKVQLAKVGTLWGVVGRMQEQTDYFRAQNGYDGKVRIYWVIVGKKLHSVQAQYLGVTTEQLMQRYENRDGKPLERMNADEVFAAGKETRPHRRRCEHMTLKTALDNVKRVQKIDEKLKEKRAK